MLNLRSTPGALPAEAEEARAAVRTFLDAESKAGRFLPHKSSWSSFDAEFSRRAGAAGLVGLTIPKAYGGAGKSSLTRFVVTEELLAAGAPCGAHWIADRQSGPQILRHGTEKAKRSILPRICRGECFFGIGMSEPNSGSDLAAARTKAVRDGDDWVISGSKIWTSNAHQAHYLLALVRTGDAGPDRHGGLTSFIVDLAVSGVSVRPILDLAGRHEFNEVFFTDYRVEDAMMVGAEGEGWSLVTQELAFERSGPDRFLSDFRLLVELVDRIGPDPDRYQAVETGRLVAQLAALMSMSASVARLLDKGVVPGVEAALVKDVGTSFEREIPEVARRLVPVEPSLEVQGDHFREALGDVLLRAPSFTLRGGTREILRGVHRPRARPSMSTMPDIEAGGPGEVDDVVIDQADRLLARLVTPELMASCDGAVGEKAWPSHLWRALEDNGLSLALVPAKAGGFGLDPVVAARLIRCCAAHALPLPLPETIAATALWTAAGDPAVTGAVSLAPRAAMPVTVTARGQDFVLEGIARQVPWGGQCAAILVDAVDADGAPAVVSIEPGDRVLESHCNLAGEPRDTIDVSGLRVTRERVRRRPHWLADATGGAVEAVGAWVRAQQIAGATERCLRYAVEYAAERRQFGRPIGKFQAVQHMLAEAAGHVAAGIAAADLAASAWAGPHFELAVAVAKSRCGDAAGKVAEVCHQVHGAMGFTHEHPLHYSTRRLWSWRDDFGHESLWQERIGRAVCEAGGDALWPMLVRLRSGR